MNTPVEIDDQTSALTNPDALTLLLANPLLGRGISIANAISDVNFGSLDKILVIMTPTGNAATVSLPASASVAEGAAYGVRNNSEKDVRLDTVSSDTIEGADEIRVPSFSTVWACKAGTDLWIVTHRPDANIGDLRWTAGATIPAGWRVAEGASLSRSTQSGLFEEIGTTYGSESGTTFNLPDLRGRCAVAPPGEALRLTTATMSGVTAGGSGGAQGHTLQGNEIPLYEDSGTNGTAAPKGVDEAVSQPASPHNNVQPTLIIGCVLIKT